jgi:hypothetical protein
MNQRATKRKDQILPVLMKQTCDWKERKFLYIAVRTLGNKEENCRPATPPHRSCSKFILLIQEVERQQQKRISA